MNASLLNSRPNLVPTEDRGNASRRSHGGPWELGENISTRLRWRTEWVLILVLGAALVACSRAEAGGVVSSWGVETAECWADGESPRHLASLAMPVLGDQWSWHRVSQAVDYVLSDQKRVLQLTVIGTCVALYLMFRTRW